MAQVEVKNRSIKEVPKLEGRGQGEVDHKVVSNQRDQEGSETTSLF